MTDFRSRRVDGESLGIPRNERGTIVTVGTFDGVHRGHWEVLREVHRRAEGANRTSVLVTFHPHPLTIVKPNVAPPLLTTPNEKKEILAESGLGYAIFLEFTRALSRYSPERFVREILVEHLGVKELVIGYDHGFGKDREGDADTMRALGRAWGFDVHVVGPVQTAHGDVVSSSRIREAIAAGDLAEARKALGRPYAARGVVVKGDGRGRDLGFPTANLGLGDPSKLLPPPGVYAVRAGLPSGMYSGALHLGPRPTFKGATPSLEVHLMDFEGDLYGKEIRIDFIECLREVEAFGTVRALVDQMEIDVANARERLAGENRE